MTELAALGIKIDVARIGEATKALDALSKAAGRAEKALTRLGLGTLAGLPPEVSYSGEFIPMAPDERISFGDPTKP
jgi:hypothetical protein